MSASFTCDLSYNMNYAEIKKCDIANGEGVRISLFVSGCRRRCKGCFNAVAWDFSYGKPFTEETEAEIFEALSPDYIAGLSLLGGDPFEPENRAALLPFLKRYRQRFPHKNVWCYTGYTYSGGTLMEDDGEGVKELLKEIDILVDGPFVEELKNIRLKFRGSSNQRVLDLKRTMESGNIVLYLT